MFLKFEGFLTRLIEIIINNVFLQIQCRLIQFIIMNNNIQLYFVTLKSHLE